MGIGMIQICLLPILVKDPLVSKPYFTCCWRDWPEFFFPSWDRLTVFPYRFPYVVRHRCLVVHSSAIRKVLLGCKLVLRSLHPAASKPATFLPASNVMHLRNGAVSFCTPLVNSFKRWTTVLSTSTWFLLVISPTSVTKCVCGANRKAWAMRTVKRFLRCCRRLGLRPADADARNAMLGIILFLHTPALLSLGALT